MTYSFIVEVGGAPTTNTNITAINNNITSSPATGGAKTGTPRGGGGGGGSSGKRTASYVFLVNTAKERDDWVRVLQAAHALPKT